MNKLNITIPESFSIPADEKELDKIKAKINGLINSFFVKSADQDYLSARYHALNGMGRMFYWSAAQTLEKYSKAFVLKSGISVKSQSHKFTNTLNKSCFTFLYEEYEFSKDIRAMHGFGLTKTIDKTAIEKFLKRIEALGSPDSRYNQLAVQYSLDQLFLLDLVVYRLRTNLLKVDLMDESLSKVSEEGKKFLYLFNDFFKQLGGVSSKLESLKWLQAEVAPQEMIFMDDAENKYIYQAWLKANVRGFN